MNQSTFVAEALLRHPDAGVPPPWATARAVPGMRFYFDAGDEGAQWALLVEPLLLVLASSAEQWSERVLLDPDYGELWRHPRQLVEALGLEGCDPQIREWLRSALLIGDMSRVKETQKAGADG